MIAAAPGVTSDPIVIGAMFFVGGAATLVYNVVAVSLRQLIPPNRLLGRINSGYRLFAWGARPLGALAGGLLGQVLGLRAVFLIMAVVMLSLLSAMTIVTDEAMSASIQDTDET